MMGGIATDDRGATSLPGLLAIGECACTGLHGANRLASNSLSECCVYGARAARAALDASLPAAGAGRAVELEPAATGEPAATTREALWRDAGLVRDAEGMARLREDTHPLARLVAELRPRPPREPRRAPPPRRAADRPGVRRASRRRARRRRARARTLGLTAPPVFVGPDVM